jgi:hypothetical protein
MKRSIALHCVLVLATQSHGCFILFLSDGRQVLVGNHEDWFAKDAAIKINQPAAGKFGSVVFTFMSEGWAQGGMNEKGLFFDAARTPYQDVQFESAKPNYPTYIWQVVLDKCATVEEALRFLSLYKLPELREAHIFLADASGEAVVIGVQNGKMAIKPLDKNYLMQTNFNPWHPELSDEPVCRRYETAKKDLSINAEASIENMTSILRKTHQDTLTVYSNIYDLKNKVIYTFNKRDFNHSIVVNLPEIFSNDNCTCSLDSLHEDHLFWKKCAVENNRKLKAVGIVIDKQTRQPIPFVNIGFFEKNIGTLSDPDGSFELEVPHDLNYDSVIFSSIGYARQKIVANDLINRTVELTPSVKLLNEVTVKGKRKSSKVARLGWMGGKDGALPFDTIQGGGAIAMLVEAPASFSEIEKLQVRLMYNSKPTLQFRFHIYAYDSVRQMPGEDLLTKEIILKEDQRFGWLRFDLSYNRVKLNQKKFFIGFEWLDDRTSRNALLKSLRQWEQWRKEQYKAGNKKVERSVTKDETGNEVIQYKYRGNMMDWPGFKNMPPFTGLMVQTGKSDQKKAYRTFERKTSQGKWKELDSTLNAVVTVQY